MSYNLGIIVAAVTLTPWLGIFAPAVGVVLGSILHLLIQIPIARTHGLRWAAGIDFRTPSVREVGRLFAPRCSGWRSFRSTS